ncbi:MAG TPA: DUF952 domain-containing protein [Ohtaekwangia sp.]
MIYHITTDEQWAEAKRLGEYKHQSLDSEGFIHCSSRDQVVKTANRYFMDLPVILILQIEEEKLTSRLIYEPSTGGELFPHVYGSINLEAVSGVVKEGRSSDGFFHLANTL